MNLISSTAAIAISFSFYLLPSTLAIGHNGRIDMLHTISHKEEIDSILNKRYTGNAAPKGNAAGEIHLVREVVDDRNDSDTMKSSKDGNINRKNLFMAAKNGYMVSPELENVVTNILEAAEIVERQSMI